MEKAIEDIERLAILCKEYISNRADAARVVIAGKSAEIIGSFFSGIAVFLVILIGFIFFGIGIAMLIGETIHCVWAGYSLAGVLFMTIGFIVWKLKNRFFKFPVLNMMLSHLYDNEDENQDHQ